MRRAVLSALAISSGVFLVAGFGLWLYYREPLVEPAPAGWTVTGRILRGGVDSPAVPASGVKVRRREGPDAVEGKSETVTDRLGQFELGGIPGDTTLQLEIDDPDSALEVLAVRLLPIEGAGRKDLGDWFLRAGSTAKFSIVGPNGAPVEGARVRTWRFRDWTLGDRTRLHEVSRKGQDLGGGEYRVERLPGGPNPVSVEAPGFQRERFDVELPLREPVGLVLKAGYKIAGAVIDPQGRPIPNAEVRGGMVEFMSPDDPWVRTDASGRFNFDEIDRNVNDVVAIAEGFFGVEVSWIPPGTTDLRLTLTPTEPFAGAVVSDEDGSGVSRAKVAFESLDFPDCEAETDAAGRFEIRRIPWPFYGLSVKHPDFVPLRLEDSENSHLNLGPEPPGGRVFRLETGRSISGTVIDSRSGAPLAGTTVTAVPSMDMQKRGIYRKEISTGGGGAFSFRALKSGPWTLKVRRTGFLRADLPLDLGSGDNPNDLVVSMGRGAAIAGRVVDPAGRSVPGARVAPATQDREEREWNHAESGLEGILHEQTVATDLEGRFRIEGLMPSAGYTLLVTRWDSPAGWTEPIPLKEGEVIEGITIRLGHGGKVEGRILDEDGNPVARARIYCRASADLPNCWEKRSNAHGLLSAMTQSNEAGSFSLSGLRAGFRELEVRAEGHPRFMKEGVRIQEGETTRLDDLVLEAGSVISGRVLDASGRVVSQAHVTAGWARQTGSPKDYGGSALSDAEGHFRIKGLRAGAQELHVRAKGYASMVLSVDAPADAVEVRLERRN